MIRISQIDFIRHANAILFTYNQTMFYYFHTIPSHVLYSICIMYIHKYQQFYYYVLDLRCAL